MSSYTINFTDPLKSTFSIVSSGYNGPGGTSSNSSLRLYGRGALEWGESVDEDLLRLSENFSGASTPASAINGQLHRQLVLYWHDTMADIWYVFDVNAVTGSGTWSVVSVTSGAYGVNSTNLPVSTLLNPITEGDYVYNTDNDRLYGYYSMFGQMPAAWLERAYTEAITSPVDGTDFPAQRMFIYNGYSDKTGRDCWEPLNLVHVDPLAPSAASKGILWYDNASLKLFNGTTWDVVGGYVAYNDYDMQGIYNITNMPEQCTGSPIGSNLSPNEAASVGFVQCYLAEQMSGGSYLPLIGGMMLGPIDMSGNTILLSAAPVNDEDAANKKYVDDQIAGLGYLPIGTMIELPYQGVVPGYLFADGRAYSATAYPDLFDALVTNSGFSIVTGCTFTKGTAPTLFTKAGHNFKGGERIRFSASGDNILNTIDYFVEYVSPSTFYISTTPYGTRLTTTGSGAGSLDYLQSYWGLGDSVGITSITSFNVPDKRGVFGRGIDTGPIGSAGIDLGDAGIGRTLGTTQKASLLYGDEANNSVNSVDKVGQQRTGLGWDAISVDHYRNPANAAVTTNTAAKYGNGNLTNDHIGGSRPRNVAMSYYIRAYMTSEVSPANFNIATLANDVATLQNTMPFVKNDTVYTTTYLTASNTYTLAHGLASTPTFVYVYLENIVADKLYVPGDRVMIPCYVNYGDNKGVTVTYDATNITILIGSTSGSTNGIKILNKDNTRMTVTDGSWTINVKAYL